MIEYRDPPSMSALPIGVLSATLALFAIVALLATGNDLVPGDELVLDTVQRLPATPFESVLDVGNLLGETIAGPVAMIVLTALCAMRRFVPGVVFCLTLLGLRLAGMYLKPVFDSPRPGISSAEIRGHFDGLGFPSGHAMTATCIAMAVTIIVPALFRDSGAMRTIVGLLWALAALCGIARIWYGAHWPTDVIGGAAAAVIMAWIAAFVASGYQSRTTISPTPTTSASTDAQRNTTSR